MPPPPNRSLERGGLGRLEKASEDGVISRAEGGTRSGRPRKASEGGGVPGRPGEELAPRAARPGRPARSRVSYLPPAWVPAASSLASL